MSGRSQDSEEYIFIDHGKLEIRVPRKVFKGRSTRFDAEEKERFEEVLSTRYPWLSEYVVEEILEKAKEKLVERIDSMKTTVGKARQLMEKGQHQTALNMIENRLDSRADNPGLWYVRGEILCRTGDMEEGYRSFHRARTLLKDQE